MAREKIWNQICDISVENRQTKFNFWNFVYVNTHTRFEILEFSLSVFYRNITILISNFFLCQNRNLWLLIDILITYINIFWFSLPRTCKNKISKIKEKTYPERCFKFRLSIYLQKDLFVFFYALRIKLINKLMKNGWLLTVHVKKNYFQMTVLQYLKRVD